jgi:small nuclear ribonucleoprotein (snRNP)-like protein
MPIFRGGGGRRPPGKKRPMMGGKKRGPGGGGGGGGGFKKKRPIKRKKKPIKKAPAPSIEITGMEAQYIKELMDEEKLVVVVLNHGDPVRGYVRYYDKDVFSLGPDDGSPKMFIRKENIRYIYEEDQQGSDATMMG